DTSYSDIQDEINKCADEINALAKYTRINYTGFLKMVKKHDRHTNYILRPMFMVRLNQCPFWKQDYDPLLNKLSELFYAVRQGGRRMSFAQPPPVDTLALSLGTSAGKIPITPSEHFQRTSVKYFVRPQNVVEVKTFILRHLPVLIYNAQSASGKDAGSRDPSITSIYLDNTSLELYNNKVERAVNAEVVRIRWYGSLADTDKVYIERKIQQEEDRGELKDRFSLKKKYVERFLKGEYHLEKTINSMKEDSSIPPQETAEFEQLVKMCRTYYVRTAFQMPGDSRVRVSLDTELSLIREDNHLFPDDTTERRGEGEWCRPDVDVDYPFSNLKENEEIVHFPYAVLELKLNLSPGQEPPRWMQDLIQSGLIEEAPQFSKYVHAIATLFETRVSLLPFWLASMDKDADDIDRTLTGSAYLAKADKKQKRSRQIAIEMDRSRGGGSSQAKRTREAESQDQATETTPLLASSSKSNGRRNNRKNEPSFFKSVTGTFRRRRSSPFLPPPGVKVPKKVVGINKVEPKVYLANERTFFAWMSFAGLLFSFSVALFNAGDIVGRISGIIYTLVSISVMIYGLGLYRRRRQMILEKHPGPYDELTGPTIICIALFFAVLLNAYLKASVKIKKPHVNMDLL
ncbi:hypothetical protein BZG36_05132, partial [Bifiguratus adelaidae]